MNLLHTVHVPAGPGPFPTILALHGWGASAHDLFGLAPLFPEPTLTLCPQGSVVVPIGPSTRGYGWFPLMPGQPPDPQAFLKGAGELRTFFEDVCERYPIDRQKIFVFGFSQGGLMGYDLVLRHPERFAGLIAASSWLPEPLAEALPRLPGQQNLPMLVVHGKRDPMIAVEKARQSRAILEDLGVAVEYEEFDMGHEIRPQTLERISTWLVPRI